MFEKMSLSIILLFIVLIFLGCNKSGLESNIPIVAPTLSTPTDGAVINNRYPMLQWNNVINAEEYEVVVDNSNDFSHPEFNLRNICGTECTTSELNSGIYYWKVRATGGPWSTVWHFEIDIEGPKPPNLEKPDNGSSISDKTPYFEWSNVSNAVMYELEVDQSSYFSSPEIHKTSLTSSSYEAASSLSDATYYWRVRAKDNNDNWGHWSNVWSFTIENQETNTVTDIDGNVYTTVKIGNQIWMAENLRVTHYRNGDPITHAKSNYDWYNMGENSQGINGEGAYCSFNNDAIKATIYGYLYNWYSVNDNRSIAPEGWHIPTDEEWKELELFLGMSHTEVDAFTRWRGTNEGGKLKECGLEHWKAPNSGATNETGFTALPGGYRNESGDFIDMFERSYFWTATVNTGGRKAWYRDLHYGSAQIYRSYYFKRLGFSVRCIKD